MLNHALLELRRSNTDRDAALDAETPAMTLQEAITEAVEAKVANPQSPDLADASTLVVY
jgi:hypothetical protein